MGKFRYWTSRDSKKKVVRNTIANEGHVAVLGALLDGLGGAGDLYVGLIDASVGFPTAFQTLASKDWLEVTNYRESARQLWNRDTVDGQSVPNQECKPTVFTMSADTVLQGFFITDVQAKGETTGKLLAISDDTPELLYEHDRLFLEYSWEF